VIRAGFSYILGSYSHSSSAEQMLWYLFDGMLRVY